MSVFNADDTPANFLETLVGEGKKFSDTESLARGKWEADRTIQERNAKLDELQAKLDELEIEKRLNASRQTPPITPEPRVEDNQPAKPSALSPEDMAKLIRAELQAERQEETVRANVDRVANKLVELYGDEDKANQVVKSKAAELGVSVEFLQEVAAKSPVAFFAQLGITDTPTASASPTRGDVNPQAFQHNSGAAKPGTYKFYEQMRKDNPKQWASIQPQIHAEALRMGSAFFE